MEALTRVSVTPSCSPVAAIKPGNPSRYRSAAARQRRASPPMARSKYGPRTAAAASASVTDRDPAARAGWLRELAGHDLDVTPPR